MTVIVFENCALLDPHAGEVRPDHSVAVEGGRVREVSDRAISGSFARRVDVGGRTLMPGLIDARLPERRDRDPGAGPLAGRDRALGHRVQCRDPRAQR